MHKVFVYGTLKKGHGNNRLLHGAKFLGERKTSPEFVMLNLGLFPGVVRNGNTAIEGEVYEVDDETLRRLDVLEGVPSLYRREVLDDDIYIYIYNSNNTIATIPSGVW